jgi:hypothetical protein
MEQKVTLDSYDSEVGDISVDETGSDTSVSEVETTDSYSDSSVTYGLYNGCK